MIERRTEELTKAIKSKDINQVNQVLISYTFWIKTLSKKLLTAISLYSQEQSSNIKEIILLLLNKSADIDIEFESSILKSECGQDSPQRGMSLGCR